MESEMKCNVSEKWSPRMPVGMDLEITHHPKTLKRVVNLIIAMDRWKDYSESLLSTEFRDENLLNMMLENIVEEQTMFECYATPTVQYNCQDEHQCNVEDSQKRSLVLVRESMELHAVQLQGGSEQCKVYLNMSTYLNHPPSASSRTVALGIKGTNLFLSCHKQGDKPTLHLEEMDKSRLMNLDSSNELVRFLFNKYDTGLNVSTLVSVPYSDWYISTAEGNNKAVQMCQENAQRYRTFNIQSVNLPSTYKMECECDSTCGDQV
nr:interleukin 1b [Platax teira]